MDKYNKINKQRWDILVKEHIESDYYDIEKFKAGKSSLGPIETLELKKYMSEISDKSILHLQCHFGMDTLSLSRMGANVTGVDYSEKSIQLARELSDELLIDAEFIQSDVLTLELKKQFDIVYTTHGVLCWLNDIKLWAKTVHNHLKRGGKLYLADGHPFASVFENDDDNDRLNVTYPYQNNAVLKFDVQGSYASDSDESYISYEWQHSLSDIINALINVGMEIEFLHEFKEATWKRFPFMNRLENGLYILDDTVIGGIPLTFSILAIKK